MLTEKSRILSLDRPPWRRFKKNDFRVGIKSTVNQQMLSIYQQLDTDFHRSIAGWDNFNKNISATTEK
jgi:hypothetical protein